MTQLTNRRSIMTLFSDGNDLLSHRVRMVLAEKGINHEIVNIDPDNLPEDLIDLNPYHSAPTLVDRDLVLYDAQLIMEYLDERFPHPPLMPVDPVKRAKLKMLLIRIKKDWDPLVEKLIGKTEKQGVKQRKELRESLSTIAPVFEQKPYFMSDEFTLVDCALAPILWRLNEMCIELPESAIAVTQYAQRIFERESFQESLSDIEEDM
ncbi:MAG: glutathione S-transferase N-terminal domain-containing protein [gamma proteobacterium symbiont of Bathyaustriella thionipta]|nr:glutathione S-transferase N-terminal domain-containing protein [gamma proteobacterium symbiont of Bathyaustriella thionipta]MCU7948410.1 glutathione S-transferase N-terminal domain-containing protein [gamma proteobacterium symbiont of Bathyaustriella thionipta]MCU7954109.1 glutathione S-transferase N-terminal domain-containing protein [gamma proteobacterium symbiont of Bathyaustriella thionipta]MCU7955402.1 glutathione S-transferase N-terminal domain-containing protein [gamma proteobacterium 